MRISIIVPVYNAEPYIGQCLDSCFGQTHQAIEVVAVNDGSTDGSGAVLDAYAAQEPRLTVVHTPNQGVTQARKTAVDRSTGEWLFFLDADDFIPPYALEHLFQEARAEQADMVVGDFTYMDPAHKVVFVQKNSDPNGNVLKAALRFDATGNLCGRLVKREVFDQIELPSAEIKLGEDMICGLQLLAHSQKTVLLNEPIYHYVQYPNSTINSRNPAKVASMIPYLRWINRYFDHTCTELRADADFFMLNEYFAYLMYGGKWGDYPQMKAVFERCNKKELAPKIQIAFSPFGKIAVHMVRLLRR